MVLLPLLSIVALWLPARADSPDIPSRRFDSPCRPPSPLTPIAGPPRRAGCRHRIPSPCIDPNSAEPPFDAPIFCPHQGQSPQAAVRTGAAAPGASAAVVDTGDGW